MIMNNRMFKIARLKGDFKGTPFFWQKMAKKLDCQEYISELQEIINNDKLEEIEW